METNFKQRLNKVRCLVFDVDGVLTNGTLVVMPGELHRIMNIRDGYALKEAVDKGYHVVIISGGRSESVRTRLSLLGIKDIYLGETNKTERLEDVITQYDLKTEEILYMGDDLPDYQVMKIVGVPCCPYDATHEIKEISVYISPVKGGEGCVRDVVEQVMRVRGDWPLFN